MCEQLIENNFLFRFLTPKIYFNNIFLGKCLENIFIIGLPISLSILASKQKGSEVRFSVRWVSQWYSFILYRLGRLFNVKIIFTNFIFHSHYLRPRIRLIYLGVNFFIAYVGITPSCLAQYSILQKYCNITENILLCRYLPPSKGSTI